MFEDNKNTLLVFSQRLLMCLFLVAIFDCSGVAMGTEAIAATGSVASESTAVDGTVLVNGLPADSNAAGRHQTTVVNSDGTFVRDQHNRLISSESPDGKLKRSYKYGDAKNPNKVTTVVENGTSFEYLSPIRIATTGEVVKREELEMSSWTIYDSNRKLKGNWCGYKSVSAEGVYVEYDNNKADKVKFQDGTGKELTPAEAEARNKDGIWPSKISVGRPDGSSLEASLRGRVVESLKETRLEGGKATTVTWTKSGEQWLSDQTPSSSRTALSLGENGDLSFCQSDGKLTVETKNGELHITTGGVKDSYDRHGQRVKIESTDGSRQLEYIRDASGVSAYSRVTTTNGDVQIIWSKNGSSDEWISEKLTETRKDLKVLVDGTLQFVDKDGKRVKETISRERITYNSSNLPELVTFPSGAQRKFVYDQNGLSKFSDTIPIKGGGQHELVWERVVDGSFASTRDGKVYRREQVSVSDDADVKYLSADKQAHEAKVRDIDRIARGEFVLSSESIVEARNRLVEAVKKSGLREDRFNKWIKEFEENAVRDKTAPERIVKTMNNLSDILSATDKSIYFDSGELKGIVETGMHNIARYLEIDQGSHPTCNVTSVEVVAARSYPDEYSRLLKEVALSGNWTTSEGKTSTPTTAYKGTEPGGKAQVYNSLKPGKDELKYSVDKPDCGDRNLASQIVQMTLINTMYEHGHMDDVSGGNVTVDRTTTRYLMGPNRVLVEGRGVGQMTTDLGEDLLMKDGKPVLGKDGKPVNGGPGMDQDDVLKAAVLFFGEEPPYIACAHHYDDQQTGKRVYGNDLPDKQRLLDMRLKSSIPILTPTMGGLHAQSIHDVWEDPVSGELWVLLDNQHGEPEVKGKDRKSGEGDGDGWITLDQLHQTLKMPEQGANFGQPVMPSVHKYSHPSKLGK
ncbi:MAG: hypothetical protein SGJ27_08330 [Candidatus Melainabacteria bacterium]|nr:hypothetical protein [Candidatus Melainabacteria bacterium]